MAIKSESSEFFTRTLRQLADEPYLITEGIIEKISSLVKYNTSFDVDAVEAVTGFLNNDEAMTRAMTFKDKFTGLLHNFSRSLAHSHETILTFQHRISTLNNFSSAVLNITTSDGESIDETKSVVLKIFNKVPGYDEKSQKIFTDVITKNNNSISDDVRGCAIGLLKTWASGNGSIGKTYAKDVAATVLRNEEHSLWLKVTTFKDLTEPYLETCGYEEGQNLVLLPVRNITQFFGDKKWGGWAVERSLEWGFKRYDDKDLQPRLIEGYIEAARFAEKDHPVHKAISYAASEQPKTVKKLIEAYIARGIAFAGPFFKDSPESVSTVSSYFLENKKDALSGVGGILADMLYGKKAKQIFADYAEGLTMRARNVELKIVEAATKTCMPIPD